MYANVNSGMQEFTLDAMTCNGKAQDEPAVYARSNSLCHLPERLAAMLNRHWRCLTRLRVATSELA